MKQPANDDETGRCSPANTFIQENAILPSKRIVAYYGNFYSAQMGILGSSPPEQMLAGLIKEVKKWEDADPVTPVLPAIHYIAVTAQKNAGADRKYRLRMPFAEIDTAIALAKQVNGIVFLDIQVGLSSLAEEISQLNKYLEMPQVHLGIDPEYSMKNGQRPGTSVGTLDASDINFVAAYLAALVNKNNLPPKVLVVHRFTAAMLTNYRKINLHREVQLVINMDGFGSPAKKRNTYYHCIFKEPVQFTGFKLFYKYDSNLMSPEQVMKLKPIPVYIQYQ